jgi:hypothetical protein
MNKPQRVQSSQRQDSEGNALLCEFQKKVKPICRLVGTMNYENIQ